MASIRREFSRSRYDLMPISNCVEIVQRSIEEGREVVVFKASGDGSNDLIEIQVLEEIRRCLSVNIIEV